MEPLYEEIAKRARAHQSQASTRPLSPNFEMIGIAGEVQFSYDHDVKRNREINRAGDGGIDFVMPDGTKINVKTRANCRALLHEKGKHSPADLIVVGQFHDEGEVFWVEFMGWEFVSTIEQAPIVELSTGVTNHEVAIEDLRSMTMISSFGLSPLWQRKWGQQALDLQSPAEQDRQAQSGGFDGWGE
jgi:hypothetical protein